jgi:hypothetical protein
MARFIAANMAFVLSCPFFITSWVLGKPPKRFVSTLVPTCELPQPIPDILELG